MRKRKPYHHGNLREELLDAAIRLIAEVGPTAFTLREIRSQIRSRGLGGLVCELASDRHWVVWGHLPRGVQKTPPP